MMELLTVDEVARLLKLNPVTVRRFISDGRLPAVRVGRRVRIHREAVEALVTPMAPKARDLQQPPDSHDFAPLTEDEAIRQRALYDIVIARRAKRNIAPLTTVDLIREVRELEAKKYEKP